MLAHTHIKRVYGKHMLKHSVFVVVVFYIWYSTTAD